MSGLSFGRKGKPIRLSHPPSWRAELLDLLQYLFTGNLKESELNHTHKILGRFLAEIAAPGFGNFSVFDRVEILHFLTPFLNILS